MAKKKKMRCGRKVLKCYKRKPPYAGTVCNLIEGKKRGRKKGRKRKKNKDYKLALKGLKAIIPVNAEL